MIEWTEVDAYIVDEWTKRDETYQQLQTRMQEIERAYQAVLKNLNPACRDLIISHEYYSVEMEYQRARLAYRLGKLRAETNLAQQTAANLPQSG